MTVRKSESPEMVHGRLQEALHIAGYSFGRACDELKWLLRQDRWKSVGRGFEDVDVFLATLDFSELRASRDDRQDIVRQLAAIKASQRATARLLGVDERTVRRDITAANAAPRSASSVESQLEQSKPPATTAANAALATRPYYSENGITIYHGDAREIVPTLPHGLMVTDPPYNVGYHYNEHDDAMPPEKYAALLYAVLRMPLVLIHYAESLFPIAQQFHRAPDKIVAWVYHANTPRQWRALAWFGAAPDLTLITQPYRNPTDKRIRALIAKGREGARAYDWWEFQQVKNVNAEKWAHPCQIPLALMERVLRVTEYDGPIIDPFCGSGSTLVAAQKLGRSAIGIECSEEYCEIAVNRLRQRSLELVAP